MANLELTSLEFISKSQIQILESLMQIKTIDDLWKSNPEEICVKTELNRSDVQIWFEIIDLLRIPRINVQFAVLLNHIKINSAEELSYRSAIRILYKLEQLNETTYFKCSELPSLQMIETWIQYAKMLTRNSSNPHQILLISYPCINFNVATNLLRSGAATLTDFVEIFPEFSFKIAKKFGFSSRKYHSFLRLNSLILHSQINLIWAQHLLDAGFHSAQSIREISFSDFQTIFLDYFSDKIEKLELDLDKQANRIYQSFGGEMA